MNPCKILSPQEIHIIRQLFRISPALHKGNDALLSLTVLIYQTGKLLPERVFFSFTDVHIGAKDFKTDLFFHKRSNYAYRLRRQITGRRRQRSDGGGQAYTLQGLPAQSVKPGQGQHQMGSSLGVDKRVKLVDNHRFCSLEDGLPRL